MALSNWDTLAIDIDSKSTEGELVGVKSNASVSIYKNWLYVRDAKAWHEGSRFTNNIVMEIQHGSLIYGDIVIHAERSPQKQGVMVLAYSQDYETLECRAMLGIGVYGFVNTGVDEDAEWVGVEPSDVALLKDFQARICEDEYLDDRIASMSLDNAMRFNQGDAYIATKLGMPVVPGTHPGVSEDPLLMRMFAQADTE